jgi:hypothetical protein
MGVRQGLVAAGNAPECLNQWHKLILNLLVGFWLDPAH